MSTLESIKNSNTCFQAQALPEIRFRDKLTRFDIELNLRTGIISKTCDDPSKLSKKSIVSSSIPSSIDIANCDNLLSVYLIAAGGSFGEPKFPCGSISGCRSEKG